MCCAVQSGRQMGKKKIRTPLLSSLHLTKPKQTKQSKVKPKPKLDGTLRSSLRVQMLTGLQTKTIAPALYSGDSCVCVCLFKFIHQKIAVKQQRRLPRRAGSQPHEAYFVALRAENPYIQLLLLILKRRKQGSRLPLMTLIHWDGD